MSSYSINAVSGTPIYRQIVDQTRQLVASGQLPPGERLPSVRVLGAELGINPMTVSRVYSLLERDGVVARHRSLRMVVLETTTTPADAIRPEAIALIEVAQRLRLTREEVARAIDLVWTDDKEHL